MATDKTKRKHSGLIHYKPGQSGNPAGRPKGSRNKLGEAFIKALADDFKAHGPAALVAMRKSKPNEYIRVIASLLPKELNIVAGNPFEDISNEELRILYDAARSVAVIRAGDSEAGSQGGTGSLH